MNYRFCLDTPQILADEATKTKKDVGITLLTGYTERAASTKLIFITRKSELADLQADRQRVFELRESLDAEISRAAQKLHRTIIKECKTIEDASRYAEKSAKQLGAKKCLNYALLSADSIFIPDAILALQIANANWRRETGNRLMAEALIAAIERYEASRQLAAVDGTPVQYDPAKGRAHALWHDAMEAHRLSAEAQIAVDIELQRRAKLEALSK